VQTEAVLPCADVTGVTRGLLRFTVAAGPGLAVACRTLS
jgi:hypothetical protein